MKLNIKERLIIPNILPREGDYTTLIIKKDLLDKIKINQDDISEFEIRITGEEIQWNTDKEKEIDVELSELEIKLITDSLKELDKQKKLNDETALIYKKIVCNSGK